MEDPSKRSWRWLFAGEAAGRRFAGVGRDDVPSELRPIVLGHLRFPKRGGMTLETNSIQRAVEAARFFGPRLGPEVVALRCGLVNRHFAADEAAPEDLMKHLDRNVVTIDPREVQAQLERDLEGVNSQDDFERVMGEHMQRRLDSGEDVPPVEDFPLAPEEETPDFEHLAATLQFRFVRAAEHWRGNTHLTLTHIIVRAVGDA